MPSLSPTMTEGSIANWVKKEGEELFAGDVLCEVQTDKAVVALEAEEDGTLAKILITANKPNIQVGDLIAVIATPDEDWKEVAASAPTESSQPNEKGKASPAAETPEISASPSSPAPETTAARATVGPAVRLLLQKHGLEAPHIPASGPRGQLLKEDVLTYIQSHPAGAAPLQPAQVSSVPAPAAGSATMGQVAPVSASTSFTDIPLSNMRLTIAKRLTQSKSTIPHAFVRTTANLDKLMALRKQLKANAGIKVSVNDMIIKACALGLRLVPEINALTDTTGQVASRQPTVDICMAVATPAGLITPILRAVDQLPISEISTTAVGLAKRARDGKLQPHEFQGGSFTISNLGMFGIREFTAIINPPQVAILAVGSGQPRPVLADTELGLSFANEMTLTLSIDSRHIDEVMAGRFLTHVSRLLSTQSEWLLADDPSAMRGMAKSSEAQDASFDPFDTLMLTTTTTTMLNIDKASKGKVAKA